MLDYHSQLPTGRDRMRSYRRFVFRLAAIAGLMLAVFCGFLYEVNRQFFDTTLKDKTYLLELKPQVVFAGDSRGQRQLDPLYFRQVDPQRRLAVNVASEAASIMSLAAAIDQYPEVFAQATVVISVSSNQVNEGALTGAAYPPPMIARLSLWEQLLTFAPDHLEVLQIYYRRTFKTLRKQWSGRLKGKRENEPTLGFKPIDQVWDYASLDPDYQVQNHPWGAKWQPDGNKSQLFREHLLKIRDRVARLVVFAGPIAPYFLERLEGTQLIENEQQLDRFMLDFCGRNGIQFRSYTFDRRFIDADFYDPYHLNVGGARKLTEALLRDIGF